MRNGIAFALEQAEDKGRFREGVRLSLKDYDESQVPQVLGRQTMEQVRENEAILVIGPLFSTRAETVATYANRYSFPLLTPAVSQGVTNSGIWAFRSGMSPHDFIESMVKGAIGHLRPRRVAVIYPTGNPGFESQARTVAQAATRQGTLVVGELGVDADESGFTEAAAALRSVSPDAIFICMDAEPAGALASRLHAVGVTAKARLVFGPASAQPELIEVGRQYVEGALVATDYLPELPGEMNRSFVASYRERFGVKPDRWAGIGYATGLVAAEAIRNAGPSPNRALVREALERGASLSVPLGQQKWTMGTHHEPRYEAAFFQITSGAFVPLGSSR
jgi:branched-chain amino acid transport system substrate-binding protein